MAGGKIRERPAAKLVPTAEHQGFTTPTAPADPQPPARNIAKLAAERYAGLMQHRETYLAAWLAATGLHPTECVLVQQDHGNGSDVGESGRDVARAVGDRFRPGPGGSEIPRCALLFAWLF